MVVASGELLFVKSVKDGIPNRDPLAESDARRIFDEADGRISLSDVSIKRDVRDYVLDRFPEGGADKRHFVFVREERDEKGNLLSRAGLAQEIRDKVGAAKENLREVLPRAAFDVRVFGTVFSVPKEPFHFTGPVQFGWAHSLHPVESRYVQGTVVMPSGDEKGQGTIWSTYIVPFAVFAMPGLINHALAEKTGMADDDVELLLEALWKGTQHRQARGRGIQQPLFLLHVEYHDPFFRIGYLEEGIRLLPGADAWRQDVKPSQVSEIQLDVTKLGQMLASAKDKISRCRLWVNPELRLVGELPAEPGKAW
ncbi:MAG: type I-B CRISPR-associated protein Cas7/Csh2 [Firmicutes bacterium]|nr:type I-B CRISPR-associated protein Cas7/Csh2 [Bacillota bacterium]